MNTSLWDNEDPRKTIDKEAQICIWDGFKLFKALVDVKHSYCIFTDRDVEPKCIFETGIWPTNWRWIQLP